MGKIKLPPMPIRCTRVRNTNQILAALESEREYEFFIPAVTDWKLCTITKHPGRRAGTSIFFASLASGGSTEVKPTSICYREKKDG